MSNLYENIKQLRISLKMTQTELAEKTGYSDKSMIAKIEKGVIDLPESKIDVFAKALCVSPARLMGWDDSSDNTAHGEQVVVDFSDKPALRALVDAAQGATDEELRIAYDMLSHFKKGGDS